MTNNKQIAPIQQLTKDIAGQQKQLTAMLPAGMEVNRFMRTAVNAISTHAQSDKLIKANRQSLFSACQKAAGDGLLLDGKEATLTVFKDQVVYMPMTQGLVKLARNSGEISTIIAEVVYEKDPFQYRPGLDDQPIHEPDWFGNRGKPVGVYAVVTTKTGEKIVSVLPAARVMAIAKGGQNSFQYDPNKGPHFGEWWKKTAIKNVLKYAPKSTYLEQALDHDNEHLNPDAMVEDGYCAQTSAAPASTDDINADLNSKSAKANQKTGEVIEHDEQNPPPITDADIVNEDPI